MPTLVTDPRLEERLKAERKTAGADRYDEVWEGVYVMVPMPGNEHQRITGDLTAILQEVLGWRGLGEVFPGINLSDRKEGWEQNYRVPDVAVFLREGKAENCGTHWRGAADFLAEVATPGDRTREKISFYAQLGVEELLVVERQPWRLELYRRQGGQLKEAGQSTAEGGEGLVSEKVPLSFQLLPGEPHPEIEVTHPESGRRWRTGST